MNLFITKRVNLFLISLNIITYEVEAFNCTDLKLCCGLCYGIGTIQTPPSQCTALSVSKFDPVLLADLNSVKGTLPLMVIDDRFNLRQWNDIVTKPAKDYVTEFINLGVDVIALNIIGYNNDYSYTHTEFSKNIAKFLEDAKREFPLMLFGIAFTLNEDPIKSSVDLKVLNKHVDFYLLEFIMYRSCDPVEGVRDMVYAASKDDIIGSLSLFRNAGMETNKLIYTIDLRIFTHKTNKIKADSEEIMEYWKLCSKEVSIHRKFCYNSIEGLFDKAQLLIKENLLGIYVDNVDYDDYNASCQCAGSDGAAIKFKGISVIAEACCDDKVIVDSFRCAMGYPIIKNP